MHGKKENPQENKPKRKYTKRAKEEEAEGNEKWRNGRWTREEKQLFINCKWRHIFYISLALIRHGKDWKKVEQSITTRSGA